MDNRLLLRKEWIIVDRYISKLDLFGLIKRTIEIMNFHKKNSVDSSVLGFHKASYIIKPDDKRICRRFIPRFKKPKEH